MLRYGKQKLHNRSFLHGLWEAFVRCSISLFLLMWATDLCVDIFILLRYTCNGLQSVRRCLGWYAFKRLQASHPSHCPRAETATNAFVRLCCVCVCVCVCVCLCLWFFGAIALRLTISPFSPQRRCPVSPPRVCPVLITVSITLFVCLVLLSSPKRVPVFSSQYHTLCVCVPARVRVCVSVCVCVRVCMCCPVLAVKFGNFRSSPTTLS